jgi:hypothetical protein
LKRSFATVLLLAMAVFCHSQTTATPSATKIPPSSKIFINPMHDGFDTYLKAALAKKQVPLIVVESKEAADFIISGAADSQKASAAKKAIMWDWHSNEEGSIRVSDKNSGVVVFAYTAVKNSSAHGKQSTAEACAKHLKDKVESGK